MDEKVCPGCGKRYWERQSWQHEKCSNDVGDNNGVSVVEEDKGDRKQHQDIKQRWSREAYNAYMREYMRARRGK